MFFNLLVQFSLQSVRIEGGGGGVGGFTRPLTAVYLYRQSVTQLSLLSPEPQSGVKSS